MFLFNLYKHSKGLFFLFAGFLLAFVFINAKQGAVITPVYQYGMFSEPFYRDQKYVAYQFSVNGETVSLKNLSFPARDIMLVSLQNYLISAERNSAVYHTMQSIVGRIVPLPSSLLETAKLEDFNLWYSRMVSQLLKRKVSSLEVFQREVSWINGIQIQEGMLKSFPVAEQ